MSVRLQVLMDEDELTRVRGAADREGVTVAEWVRQALKRAVNEQPGPPDRKIAVVRAAAKHEFPVADIEYMLAEIDAGRRVELP